MNDILPARKIRNTFRFQRMFWRIFFGFWLSSIAIMFATTYVLTGDFESNQLLRNLNSKTEERARRIIKRLEREKVTYSEHITPILAKRNPRREGKSQLTLSIYDDNKTRVFGPPKHARKESNVTFMIKSEQGRSYTVYTQKPRMPRFIKEALYKLNSIQLVFIFIVSTLISLLLSWSITKPLKRLSHFSQQYSPNSKTLKVDSSLLERKDEIGDLAGDISRMMMQIETTFSSQKQLMHDVSHELRAPLARLQVSVALIEQDYHDHTNTEQLHTELRKMNQLIQQILDYSRQNEQVNQETHVDLVEMIHHIIDNLSKEYPEQAFTLFCEPKKIKVNGFETALTSAFENILQNACKYSSKNKDIEIDLKVENNKISISAKNYGDNIPEEDLEKILQPFYRAGNKMHTEGFGLGLSIANKAIIKHGGTLSVTNHTEGGVIVTCTLHTC